ncbi:hypothetical protein PPACK8108_LOCUS24346 [Phakopsora pachyrhizi]|uniref:Uncharacterized protein n=1 Tax=Phakopsora pachyrhizi TaxID=170000 RepID=A0AAV0BRT4_PHAPC|nr:hypothetical protein PPACK8108_LOCUS24346 [Phakopsora pachyrhizi]
MSPLSKRQQLSNDIKEAQLAILVVSDSDSDLEEHLLYLEYKYNDRYLAERTSPRSIMDLKTAYLNGLDEEMCYLKAQARQNKYCTNQTWETDRISRAPQMLNAECFYASVEGIDEVEMESSISGSLDQAHNAAYLGESTPPIETFIKLSSLTKLKKSLRSKSQQRMYFAYRLSSNQLKISDPIPLTSAFQAIRSRARLEYTLDDKNEDGDEVIEDIREAAKPFHLRKGSNIFRAIVNVLAHIREDLRMAMVMDTKRTGEMGSLVSVMRKEGSLEWDSCDSGWAMEGLANTVAALSQYSQVLRVIGRILEGFEGYEQPNEAAGHS